MNSVDLNHRDEMEGPTLLDMIVRKVKVRDRVRVRARVLLSLAH